MVPVFSKLSPGDIFCIVLYHYNYMCLFYFWYVCSGPGRGCSTTCGNGAASTSRTSHHSSWENRWVSVWRRWNKAHSAECILPTRRLGRVTIQVWQCVSYACKLPLLRVQGRLTGQRYPDEVLGAAVDHHLDTHPLWGPRGSPIFQQDNAPVHTARVCRDFLHTNLVDIMPWPSWSPKTCRATLVPVSTGWMCHLIL